MSKKLKKLRQQMIPTKVKKWLKTQRRKPFFCDTVKKITVFFKYRKKTYKSSCINFFYKEVFKMEENEIKITEEMDKELSNGKEEGEE